MKYSGDDFYCDVAIPKKIPLEIEYESETVLAYHHTKPHWPVHIVVTPKEYIDSFETADLQDPTMVELMNVVQKLATKTHQEQGDARVLTNLGTYQDSKHLHWHVCSGDSNKY